MTFELFRIMTLVSSDDISFFFILGLMKNVMTTLIPMAVPISIFFSTIFCLNRMSGDSEYVALRAQGLDKLHILRPFLIVALMVSICVYFFGQNLVPGAHRQVRKKIKIISSTSLIQGLKSGQFFTTLPNVTLFPNKVDEQTKELEGVYLHLYDPEILREKIIVAKEGRILHKKDAKTGLESLKLFLKDGNILDRGMVDLDVEKVLFEEYTFPISEKRFSYQTSTKEIMMTRSELTRFIDGGLEKAKADGFDKKDFFNAKYEYWNRLNTPILCFLLTFVGFSLGITGNRGRSKNSSGKAISLLIGYYILYFALVSQAKEGAIAVPVAMIIPALILLFVGWRMYRNLDWLS